MENIANSVLLQSPDYSTHDMSEQLLTTTGLGRLTPCYIQEVIPGDTVDINAEFLTKMQPLATPALQNLNAYVHYFYVPNRILWNNWKYFIQNEKAPAAIAPPLHPYVDLTGESSLLFDIPAVRSIYPYLGFSQATNLEYVNALPMAAYQLIYNEYFRHEQVHDNNQDSLKLLDGDNAVKLSLLRALRYRTYKDDYFTMALQAPQSGDAAALALVSEQMLPVYRNDNQSGVDAYFWKTAKNTTPTTYDQDTGVYEQSDTSASIDSGYLFVNPNDAQINITMNDLIELQRMQEFLVRKNLSGNRYNEYILAIFGVRVPDLRIDRPDYICGVKAPVTISEVLNTAELTSQGYQSGQGNSYAEGGSGNYKVLEHGWIIGIYSCIPQQSYQNAVSRFWLKNDYTDYYAPIFDQMGEREVYNMEVCQAHATPMGTFGYVPKYAEYRMTFNKITGQFVTDLTTWHLGRFIPDDATLNNEFFDIDNPLDIMQIVDPAIADPIMLWLVNKVFITRPMKKYSMPVLSNNYGNGLS